MFLFFSILFSIFSYLCNSAPEKAETIINLYHINTEVVLQTNNHYDGRDQQPAEQRRDPESRSA